MTQHPSPALSHPGGVGAPLGAAAEPSGATPPSAVVEVVLRPLREEVARTEAATDGPDRAFRRELDEVLYDCGQGLTSYTAGRAVRSLDGELAGWFRRRQEAEGERNAELTRVISTMGQALKGLQGEDSQFFQNLSSNLDRMKSAADTSSVKTASARLARLVDEMAEDLTAQKLASERRVRHLSGIVAGLHDELNTVKTLMAEDALTGLFTRGTFDQRLKAAIDRSRLAPYRFTLVMIDLDRFKRVNDRYGHVGGDAVLKAAAQVLQQLVMRKSDLVARYGGEEMAILLDDSDGARGLRVAEQVRERLEQTVIDLGTEKHVQTASFGVAEGCESDTPDSLIGRADECLYLAKRGGRNRAVLAGEGAEGRRVPLPKALETA